MLGAVACSLCLCNKCFRVFELLAGAELCSGVKNGHSVAPQKIPLSVSALVSWFPVSESRWLGKDYRNRGNIESASL